MSVKKSIKSKAEVVDVCQSRISGIQTYAPTKGTISCAGTPYTAAVLVAIYQKCIDTRQDLANLRNQETVAMQARAAADAARKEVDAGVIQWAVNTFGPESQQAKDLGYVPRTVTPPTVVAKAAAAAKAKATREARGTMGPKAKLAIKGAAPVAPAATPATPAAVPVGPTTPKV